jgi:hypothetical protein
MLIARKLRPKFALSASSGWKCPTSNFSRRKDKEDDQQTKHIFVYTQTLHRSHNTELENIPTVNDAEHVHLQRLHRGVALSTPTLKKWHIVAFGGRRKPAHQTTKLSQWTTQYVSPRRRFLSPNLSSSAEPNSFVFLVCRSPRQNRHRPSQTSAQPNSSCVF